MTLQKLINRIYNRRFQSVFTAVLGPNQSGKTDFNLLIMEKLHELGLAEGFGSNMPLKAGFDIDFIEDFTSLKRRCQMLNPDPKRHGIKRYFFFGSEMGNWAPQDMPWLNVRFIQELQTVRKYGLNFLGDGIARIDQRILNEKHFHGVFHKVSKAHPSIAFYEDWIRRTRTRIENIPRTSIEFDTFHSASFYMEPRGDPDKEVPLNPEHVTVKKYLDAGSWAKAGIHQQEGKRALQKVLRYHYKHCIHSMQEEHKESETVT